MLLLLTSTVSVAQIEVQSDIVLMDYLRYRQLAGQDSSHFSFALRSSNHLLSGHQQANQFLKKNIAFRINSFGHQFSVNNKIALAANDGSMLPAVGLQQRATLNLSARLWKFHLQLAPEWHLTRNSPPQAFVPDPVDKNYFPRYYQFAVNNIDNYDRFGSSSINRILSGQSSLLFQTSHFAVGVSSENIWWGPGTRNSLVMSNNADPFKYYTLRTSKPIKTFLGHVESQLISGSLVNPDVEHPDNATMRNIWAGGIASKDSSNRSISGVMFSIEPKWTPGFYLGFSFASSNYIASKADIAFSNPFVNSDTAIRLGAVFMRYLMPKENAEIYIELGRADKHANFMNVLADSIPFGYVAGFRKLFKLSQERGHIQFGLELTRLQLPDPRLILTQGAPFGAPQTNSWYMNKKIRQGYTNNAQVMGAWIGPGSNSQTMHIGWIKGLRKMILSVERVQHNNDFYYFNFITPSLIANNQITNKFWADISTGFQCQWNFHGLLINGGIAFTKLFNYRWTKVDGGFSGPSSSDRNNTQFFFSLAYQLMGSKLNNK